MLPDSLFAEPVSSFQFPVPVPAVEPDAGPLHSVCFSAAWLPYVIGCLKQLFLQTTWDTTDPSALDLVQNQVSNLIDIIGTGDNMCLTGMVAQWAGTTTPTGWLACDGSAVNRVTYADLFAVIGVQFGTGDGSTTFALPDYRARVPLGSGTGSGLSTYTTGQTGGEETHTLTQAEMPSHSHSVAGVITSLAVEPGDLPVYDPNPIPGATGNTGGDGAHNNVQPYLAINFIIKT